MQEGGRKYVEIPEYQPAELGVDFEALLAERELLEKEVRAKRSGFYEDMSSRGLFTYFFNNGKNIEDFFSYLVKSEDESETGMEDEDKIVEQRAREFLQHLAKRINTEVDASHEIMLFDKVRETVDVVSEKCDPSKDQGHSSDNFVGKYHHDNDKIEVIKKYYDSALNPTEVIGNLLGSGIDDSLRTVKHELLHREQNFKKTKSWRKKVFSDIPFYAVSAEQTLQILMFNFTELGHSVPPEFKGIAAILSATYMVGYFSSRVYDRKNQKWNHESILVESQAHLSADKRRKFNDLKKLFEDKNVYGDWIKEKGDWDRLIMAYQQIKQLYALRIPEEEISALVANAKWDAKDLSYKQFSKRVEEEMAKKGLDIEDVDNLVLAEDLEEKNKALKASLITIEELKKLLEDK